MKATMPRHIKLDECHHVEQPLLRDGPVPLRVATAAPVESSGSSPAARAHSRVPLGDQRERCGGRGACYRVGTGPVTNAAHRSISPRRWSNRSLRA